MSAADGGRAHPECADVLEHINEYLDGEVTPEDLVSVREHLLDCPPCLREHDVQVALKALVRRCCQQDRAPEALRVKIMAQISTTHVPAAHGGAVRVTTTTQVSQVRLPRE